MIAGERDPAALAQLARAVLDDRIEELIGPFDDARARLTIIPGVGTRVAITILAEIGVDMTRFPTAAHLASWCRGTAAAPGGPAAGSFGARRRPLEFCR